jgi:hypothetical protein
MHGHLDTLRRQGIASTRKVSPSSCLSLAPGLSTDPLDPVDPLHSSHAFTLHRSQWSSADLTGRFPVKCVAGHEYLLIVLHHGYIHLVPFKNRSSVSYVSAYRDVISFFQSLSQPLSHLSLDSETSSDLTAIFKSSDLTFEYVPPLNHRSLPAERAIRTAKNHVISVLSYFRPHTSLSLTIAGLTYSPNLNSLSTPFATHLSLPDMVSI